MHMNKHHFDLRQPPPICSSSVTHPSVGLMVGCCCQACSGLWRTSSPSLTTLKSDTGNEVNFSGNGSAARVPRRQRARPFMRKIRAHGHIHPTTSQDKKVAKQFLLVIFPSCTTDPLGKLPPSCDAFAVKNESGDILMK